MFPKFLFRYIFYYEPHYIVINTTCHTLTLSTAIVNQHAYSLSTMLIISSTY